MTREDIKKAFPEATDEQITDLLNIHTADINKKNKALEKQVADLTEERDGLQKQLTDATEALKGFEGVDPDQLKGEVEKYRKAAEDARKDFEARITQRDQQDWLQRKLDEYGVQSPYARAQLIAEIMGGNSGASWKEGAFFGFDDFMKAAREKDATLYQTPEEKAEAAKQAELAANAPRFTAPTNDGSAPEGRKYTPPKLF